ncbi:MAG TPA: hypothetical protein VHN77_11200 [Phycisphaerales bacterium]|nr:hypothetical protein [Phycisphaerales bacterium]
MKKQAVWTILVQCGGLCMSMLRSVLICAVGWAATTATAQNSIPMDCLSGQCPGFPPCSVFPAWPSCTVLLTSTGGVVGINGQNLNGTPLMFWVRRSGLFYPEQHTFEPTTHGYPTSAILAAQSYSPKVDDQSRVYFKAVLAGVPYDQCPLVRTAVGGGPLEVLLRPGQPAPWDAAITIQSYARCWQVTRLGRVVVQVQLAGAGVTAMNDAAFIEFRDGAWLLLAREGDHFWVNGDAEVMRMPTNPYDDCNVIASESGSYLFRIGVNGSYCNLLMFGELPLSTMSPLYTRGPNAALASGEEMTDMTVRAMDRYFVNAQGDVMFDEVTRTASGSYVSYHFVKRHDRPLERLHVSPVQVPAPVSSTMFVDYIQLSDGGHITLQGRLANDRWVVMSLAPDNTPRVVAYEGQATERGGTMSQQCSACADAQGNIVLYAWVRKDWQEGYGVFVWSESAGLRDVVLPGDIVYSSGGVPETVEGARVTSEFPEHNGLSSSPKFVSPNGTYVLSPLRSVDTVTGFYLASTRDCGDLDFNNDSLFPDPQDVSDFLAVFTGTACPTPVCDDIDFNNDGLFPDTADIDALLSVFSGGPCL